MKITKSFFVCTGIAALAFSTVLAASSKRHGTDILHFSVRKTMANDGAVTNAGGRVEASQNKQGNANNQRLDIVMQKLEANGTYQLQALLDDDASFTQISEFQADADGNAALRYRKVGSSNGRGKGLGKGKNALPAALDPISNIREIMISVNSTQSVLHADLTAPDKLQYLVKRNLSTNDIDAILRIHATGSKTQFRLTAAGLNPTNDYLLALNGAVAQTNATDSKGRLVVDSLLVNPGDILDLHSVALWDSSSNVVLSTTLP